MPLPGHHQDAWHELRDGVPGLAKVAVGQGWQPVSGKPFDGHLEDAAHDISRAMYGVPRGMPTVAKRGVRIGDTIFTDAFRGNISGRSSWPTPGPASSQSCGRAPAT